MRPVIELIQAVGVVGILGWIIWSGGVKKVPTWVFNWVYQEAIRLRDEQLKATVAEYQARIEELIADRDVRLRELAMSYEARLKEKTDEAAWWRDIAMKTTGVAENVVDLKEKRGTA